MKLHPSSHTSRKGDLAEYYAVTWLWDQGFEVLKNCACTGPIDLIAMAEDGTMILIDVKTSNMVHKDPSVRTVIQKKLGVNILLFNPETRKCKFINHEDETTYSRYRNEQQPSLDLAVRDSGH